MYKNIMYSDPCNSCKYKNQACAYWLDGEDKDSACVDKLRWIMKKQRINSSKDKIRKSEL
jgi:hypothetical protein